MITEGLMALGFLAQVDFIAQDDGEGPYIREWLSDRPQPSPTAIAAAGALAPPAVPVITYKADVLRRMTDDESDIFTAALEEAPSRQRGLWYAVQYLDHADPVFASFRTSMISAFGAVRTDQILAPSTP